MREQASKERKARRRGSQSGCKGRKTALISDHLALLGQEAADESRVRSAPPSAEGCRWVGNHCKPTFQLTKVCHQTHPCGTNGAEQFPRGSTWGCSNVGCIEAVQHMLGRTETPAAAALSGRRNMRQQAKIERC
jgi:hypothetical protein